LPPAFVQAGRAEPELGISKRGRLNRIRYLGRSFAHLASALIADGSIGGSKMAVDASSLLGATQIAGTKVNPLGTTSSAAGRNPTGGPAAAAILGRSSKQQRAEAAAADTPDFGSYGYLAVTADELVLIRMTPPTNRSGTN
jgi:hypothetical protein